MGMEWQRERHEVKNDGHGGGERGRRSRAMGKSHGHKVERGMR